MNEYIEFWKHGHNIDGLSPYYHRCWTSTVAIDVSSLLSVSVPNWRTRKFSFEYSVENLHVILSLYRIRDWTKLARDFLKKKSYMGEAPYNVKERLCISKLLFWSSIWILMPISKYQLSKFHFSENRHFKPFELMDGSRNLYTAFIRMRYQPNMSCWIKAISPGFHSVDTTQFPYGSNAALAM